MARIKATFHYELPGRGLWASESALGAESVGTLGDVRVAIQLPRTETDFGLDTDPSHDKAYSPGARWNDGRVAVSVRIVRVTATKKVDFGSSDFKTDDPNYGAAHKLISELQTVAQDFLASFVARLRAVGGQHWLATSSDLPSRTWVSALEDIDAHEMIPVGAGVTVQLFPRPWETAITHEVLDREVALVSSGADVGLPNELLADAKYLAWIREPADLHLAVLLAAMACEAKIKGLLRDRARSPEQLGLVEVIIDNPRDVTVAVASLFNLPAKAVLGRSMKEENKTLFRATEALFSTRNAIAHGKPRPAEQKMRAAVTTASDVFAWLAGPPPT